MYKVIVYVRLSDQASKKPSLVNDFKMIRSSPIYIKPAHFEKTEVKVKTFIF